MRHKAQRRNTQGTILRHVRRLDYEHSALVEQVRELGERITRIETDVGWLRWLALGIAGGVLAAVVRLWM